jgi:hypothetical protein
MYRFKLPVGLLAMAVLFAACGEEPTMPTVAPDQAPAAAIKTINLSGNTCPQTDGWSSHLTAPTIGAFGSLAIDPADDKKFNYTVNAGFTIELCVKPGNQLFGYEIIGLESGTFTYQNGVSHYSYRITAYPPLTVSKTAVTYFERTWTWDIEKDADAGVIPETIGEGDLLYVDYVVKVSATSQDHDWAVSGKITIANTTGLPATITGVEDVISKLDDPDIDADVDCGVAFPYELDHGDTLICDYSADLPDAEDRLNTATVTTSGTVAGNTATEDVLFGDDPDVETDECIDVSDTLEGFLGEVCAADLEEGEYEFKYTLSFGTDPDADVQLVCGDNTIDNTADFVTNDTGATGDDDASVPIFVICEVGEEGCTPGYWRNHHESWDGYAPADEFFSVFVVTNMRGLAGDLTLGDAVELGGGGFNKLARSAVAALLNAANPEVSYPMTEAEIIAAVVAAFNTGNAEPLATQLDDYNNLGCPID